MKKEKEMARSASKSVLKSGQMVPAGYKLVPPEGGWGWVVASGALLITIMLSIPVLSFGILLKDMQSTLNISTSTASWTASVSLAVSQLISPVATICIHNFSCRKTAFFGGIVLSVGLILSSFAKDISLLLLSFGFLSGIGSGFSRIACLVIGSQYFEKKFNIFAGIIFAGFSIGRLIFTPVTEIISSEYGYRNTLFLIGGLCLNVCVGALFFQPAERHCVLEKVDKETGQSPLEAVIPDIISDADISPVSVKEKTDNESVKTVNIKTPASQEKDEQKVETPLLNSICKANGTSGSSNDITKDNSANQLAQIQPPATELLHQNPPNEEHVQHRKSHKCFQSFKNALDISLLKEPVFYIVCVSNILNYLTVMYANVFLIPLCLEKGFSPIDASLVVSAKSGVEIIGRLGGPWIQRLIKVDSVVLYIIVCLLVTLSLLVQCFDVGFIPFIISAILTGALTGGNVVLLVDVMMKSIGRKRYPSTIGLCGFTQGWFALFAGPLIGLIRDISGNFWTCYLLIVGLQFSGSLLWLVRYLTVRYRSSTQTSSQNYH